MTVVQSNEYWRGSILKMMKIVVHLAKLATSIPNQIKVIHTTRYSFYLNFFPRISLSWALAIKAFLEIASGVICPR